MLAVMDDCGELSGTMHILHQYKHCESILRWLITKHYTGRNLIELLTRQFRGSVHAMVEFIVKESNGRVIRGS